MGLLTSLELLSVTFFHISGTVPSEIFQLTHLTWLSLYLHAVTGSIPFSPFLSALSQLQVLSLVYVPANGELPASFPSALRSLSLFDIPLSGTIPNDRLSQVMS